MTEFRFPPIKLPAPTGNKCTPEPARAGSSCCDNRRGAVGGMTAILARGSTWGEDTKPTRTCRRCGRQGCGNFAVIPGHNCDMRAHPLAKIKAIGLKLRSFSQDPGKEGPFGSFQGFSDENFKHPTMDIHYHGRWFLPVLKQQGAVPIDCPLIIILHLRTNIANGLEHLEYSGLAMHLATHGFAVFSVNRNLATAPDPGDLIESTVQWTCFKSQNRMFLRNDSVSLLGHSSGGSEVIANASRVKFPQLPGSQPRTLRAVALYATALGFAPPDSALEANMVNLGSVCGSFLGINVSTDGDANAWGGKGLGLPMPTTFRVYDVIHTIEKDMIYAHSLDANKVLTHRFQNETFARAYTTAFLHKHLNSNKFYAAFLKHQALPSSIGKLLTIVQQHEDRAGDRIVAADFGKFSTPTISTTNGVTVEIVDTYVVDEFSPHQSKVLRVIWDRTMFPASVTSNRVSLTYVPGFQLGEFNLFSFRLAQGVSDNPQAFDVRIHLNNKSVLLSTVTGLIQPPIPVEISLGDATKTIMRTYAIPLSSFGDVGLTVSAIRFDFGVNPVAKSTFYLDSVQFWKI